MQVIYVYATDKTLTRCHPEGKIHKQVAVCESWGEAEKMIAGFEGSSEFKNVNWTVKKPSFNQGRYTSTFRQAKEWTRFIRK